MLKVKKNYSSFLLNSFWIFCCFHDELFNTYCMCTYVEHSTDVWCNFFLCFKVKHFSSHRASTSFEKKKTIIKIGKFMVIDKMISKSFLFIHAHTHTWTLRLLTFSISFHGLPSGSLTVTAYWLFRMGLNIQCDTFVRKLSFEKRCESL